MGRGGGEREMGEGGGEREIGTEEKGQVSDEEISTRTSALLVLNTY